MPTTQTTSLVDSLWRPNCEFWWLLAASLGCCLLLRFESEIWWMLEYRDIEWSKYKYIKHEWACTNYWIIKNFLSAQLFWLRWHKTLVSNFFAILYFDLTDSNYRSTWSVSDSLVVFQVADSNGEFFLKSSELFESPVYLEEVADVLCILQAGTQLLSSFW